MKKLFKFLAIAALPLCMAACSDDDKDQPNPDKPTVTEGAFVLCQGNLYTNIEGSLDLIDYNSETSATNLFKTANGRSMGNTPQCAIVYGSKLYIGVYESNTIEVVDRNTYKSIKQISLASETGQNPRSMVAQDGKVYVSMYNGYVARLDTTDLNIDKTVQVGPNPETIAIRGNYLYVPNSDGMNYMVGYGTTASKIDLSTFTVEKTFTVGLNPTVFASNGSDLFLLCMGDYGATPAKIYRLNDNDESTELVEATLMTVRGNNLYYINSPFGAEKQVYGKYDIANGKFSDMLTSEAVDWPGAVGVDPVNGNIIITSYVMDNGYPSYSTNGYAKVYDSTGKFIRRYEVGVVPSCIFFNYK